MPPKVTAGLARSRVSGCSRSPAPPASSTPSVSFISLTASLDGRQQHPEQRMVTRRISGFRPSAGPEDAQKNGLFAHLDAHGLQKLHVLRSHPEFRVAARFAAVDQRRPRFTVI